MGRKGRKGELCAPLRCSHSNRFQVNFLVVIVGLRVCQKMNILALLDIVHGVKYFSCVSERAYMQAQSH